MAENKKVDYKSIFETKWKHRISKFNEIKKEKGDSYIIIPNDFTIAWISYDPVLNVAEFSDGRVMNLKEMLKIIKFL